MQIIFITQTHYINMDFITLPIIKKIIIESFIAKV